jgi:hypothetical protein
VSATGAAAIRHRRFGQTTQEDAMALGANVDEPQIANLNGGAVPTVKVCVCDRGAV